MTKPEIVVVGGSWGGLAAVTQLLADLRADFEPAMAIVLHRAPDAPQGTLSRYLQERSALPLVEIDDKDAIEPGHVYLAPADYHTLVEPGSFALSLEAPVQYSRPSIDVLFETAADAYGPAAVGALLTGTNHDGTAGITAIKQAGGITYAQDPTTAERSEMPLSAIATGNVDHIVTVELLAAELNDLGCAR